MLLSLLNCREALERLDDYLDRELSAPEIALVERHLKLCRRCARRFGDESRFLEELKTKLDALQVPPGLHDRMVGSLPSSEPPAGSQQE